MNVTVTQDKNLEPRAEAGEDFEVALPTSVVMINGSKSWDDFRIAK